MIDLAGHTQSLDGASLREGSQEGDGPTPVGDFNRLAPFHQPQQLAGSLPQLADSDPCHMLLIAPRVRADSSFLDHHPDPAEVQRPGEWGAGIALTLGGAA